MPSLATRLAVLAALSAPAVLASGCGPKATLKREDKEQLLLDDSARLFWQARRWGDAERAAAFVEHPGDQALYKDWFIEQNDQHKLEDATILQAVMTPELDEPKDGRLRYATVYVRTRGYTYPAQIVETERIAQKWYRTAHGWFIDWDRDLALDDAESESAGTESATTESAAAP